MLTILLRKSAGVFEISSDDGATWIAAPGQSYDGVTPQQVAKTVLATYEPDFLYYYFKGERKLVAAKA